MVVVSAISGPIVETVPAFFGTPFVPSNCTLVVVSVYVWFMGSIQMPFADIPCLVSIGFKYITPAACILWKFYSVGSVGRIAIACYFVLMRIHACHQHASCR